MLSLARRIQRSHPCLLLTTRQFQSARTDSGSRPPPRRRSKHAANLMLKKTDDKSEWWVVDGEMHEIGENVPPRERFIIPRQNLPNKRRKQLREQFMRRTRLILKEAEHEPWCKRYMELYNEMRENWERLYWDEGYSKKLAQDHANYDSAEEDDEDFNPNRRRQQYAEPMKEGGFGRNRQGGTWEKEGGFGRNRQGGTWEKEGGMGRNRQGEETWEKVSLIRDKFEYDRERRMREKAFAPMTERNDFAMDDAAVSKNQPFDPRSYLSDDSDSD